MRIPLTRDPDLFEQARQLGLEILHLHTFNERGSLLGQTSPLPNGPTKNTVTVTGNQLPTSASYDQTTRTLHVGNGQFTPVTPEVYGYTVSGWPVVQRWLEHRTRKGRGKRSSPLDHLRPGNWTADMNTELLDLLNVLHHTITRHHPAQAKLLADVIASPCVTADDLTTENLLPPPETSTQAPAAPSSQATSTQRSLSASI